MCLFRGNVATSGCCVVVCLCLFRMSFCTSWRVRFWFRYVWDLHCSVRDSSRCGHFKETTGSNILSSRGNCVQLLYVMCFQTCFRGKCGYKVTWCWWNIVKASLKVSNVSTCSALCCNSSSRRVRIWMWWVAAWTLVFPCHTFASSPIAAMSHKVISSGVACLSLPAAPQYAQKVCIMCPCFFAFLSWSNSSNVHWLNAFGFVDSTRVFSPLLLLLILSNVPRLRGCLGYWVATVALNHVDVQARFA